MERNGFSVVEVMVGVVVVAMLSAAAIFWFGSEGTVRKAPTAQTTVSLNRHIIYNLNGAIYSAKPDGNGQQLLVGSKVGFAGTSNDGSTIYYLQHQDDWFMVKAKDVTTGSESTLYSFNSRLLLAHDDGSSSYYDKIVAVRPDGAYAVGEEQSGLMLHNLKTGAVSMIAKRMNLGCYDESYSLGQKLVQRLAAPVYAAVYCESYQNPRWSPDGKYILARVGFYEGNYQVVLDPFGPTFGGLQDMWSGQSPTFKNVYSAGDAVWSPDGKAVLVYANAGFVGGVGKLGLASSSDSSKVIQIPKSCNDADDVRYAAWLDASKFVYLVHANRQGDEIEAIKVCDLEAKTADQIFQSASKVSSFMPITGTDQIIVATEDSSVRTINVFTKQLSILPIKISLLLEYKE